ncbi:MAG: hemerythrin domain-containing protein [Rhodanobacter sp.]
MNFFGRKKQDQELDVTFADQLAEQQVAPGTQLHYDSRLIMRLRAHHDALSGLASKAMESAQASRFDETKKHVRKFKLLLNEHLLERNLRLYTYLNCCLQLDPEGLDMTRNMRREMSDLSRKSTRFISRYEELGINEESKTAFVEELAQITASLVDRFAREEQSLYTMYQPPQSYPDSATSPPAARHRPLAPVSLAAAC